MNRNWFQRRHGWTCRDCGQFNDVADAACECQWQAELAERNLLLTVDNEDVQ